MAWIDALPPARREFINEYGIEEYHNWQRSKRPMSDYIEDLERRRITGLVTNAP